MSAIRVARAFTGKPGIVKFAGCYHGHVDALLVRAGSGGATFGTPDSEGVPEAFVALTRVAQFNELREVEGFLRSYGREIAAVIVEPVVGNMGVVLPKAGFLEGLRELTKTNRHVADFRRGDHRISLGQGGRAGADGYRCGSDVSRQDPRWRPTASCVRRPKRDHGQALADRRRLSGRNALGKPAGSVAAGLATLRELGPKSYVRLEALGARLEEEIRRVLRDRRVPAVLNRAGSMWTIFFGVDRRPQLHRGQRSGHQSLRAVLPWDARAWILPAPVAIRGGVPFAGTQRGRESTAQPRQQPRRWVLDDRPEATAGAKHLGAVRRAHCRRVGVSRLDHRWCGGRLLRRSLSKFLTLGLDRLYVVR